MRKGIKTRQCIIIFTFMLIMVLGSPAIAANNPLQIANKSFPEFIATFSTRQTNGKKLSAPNNRPFKHTLINIMQRAQTTEKSADKQIFARFVDANGKGLSGLNIVIDTSAGPTLKCSTNTSGRAEIKSFPYGTSYWAAQNGLDFELMFKTGTQIKIEESTKNNATLTAPNTAQKLFLTFKADGNGFKLISVTENSGDQIQSFGLILICIIIVAGVSITIAAVKHATQKPKDPYQTAQFSPPIARTTGGRNKLGRREKDQKDDYNDNQRL